MIGPSSNQNIEQLIRELQKSLEKCLQTRQVTWNALYIRSYQVGGRNGLPGSGIK